MFVETLVTERSLIYSHRGIFVTIHRFSTILITIKLTIQISPRVSAGSPDRAEFRRCRGCILAGRGHNLKPNEEKKLILSNLYNESLEKYKITKQDKKGNTKRKRTFSFFTFFSGFDVSEDGLATPPLIATEIEQMR